MSEVITFSRALKHINIEGMKVGLPEWTYKRISYYRFHKSTNQLVIICKECEKSFPVLEIIKIGDEYSWKDIHNDEEYHFSSEKSGYTACCRACQEKLKHSSRFDSGSGNLKGKDVASKERGRHSYTVFLTEENKIFLQLRKIAYGEEINSYINRILDMERTKNPLTITKGKQSISLEES
ncbi:hypothetical protein NNC19_10945 [Clostridium sp. SHJSY1]|uniref:hypothetical protein n=1 Tax=Clostridium sp. SHJSY1 TaxID=2942483 RepID=UPI0028741D73|nr:hypothetical protein [Clostridium sp. SHJSY1]MDS0526198.1 hypothetical protein [Clostridium sp. SHJSY1]